MTIKQKFELKISKGDIFYGSILQTTAFSFNCFRDKTAFDSQIHNQQTESLMT